jgi:ABC-type lipopolysaccharide export system ATPase subunit
LAELKRSHPHHLGLVTKELPLLSNLSAWQNIALIKQYHENMGIEKSYQMTLDFLIRLGIESVAHKRAPQLTEEEIFFIKLIRAVMLLDAEIAIDRPFRQVGESFHPELLHKHLQTLSGCYLKCIIFDYQSNRERYTSFNL